MANSGAAKNTVRKVLLLQLLVSLLAAAVSWWLADFRAAYSALIGGGINLLTTAYFARRVFAAKPGSNAKRMVRAFYIGEVIKIVMTVALFAVVFVWVDVAFLPLFITYAVTMLAFWLALPFAL